jgi:hypothetical protein
MEPTSSPAIASLEGGGFEIAFVGMGSHHLWVLNTNTGLATDTSIGVAEHSSPTITGMPGGGYVVAVAGFGSGELWTYSPSRGEYAHHNLYVQPNTNPSITAADAGYVVAFSGMGSRELWTYSSAWGQFNHHSFLAPNTSPSIAATGTGYTMGFTGYGAEQFNTAHSESNTESFANSGVKMLSGSSPGLAATGNDNYTAVFGVPSNFLETLKPFVGLTNLYVGVATGTNPSVAYG